MDDDTSSCVFKSFLVPRRVCFWTVFALRLRVIVRKRKKKKTQIGMEGDWLCQHHRPSRTLKMEWKVIGCANTPDHPEPSKWNGRCLAVPNPRPSRTLKLEWKVIGCANTPDHPEPLNGMEGDWLCQHPRPSRTLKMEWKVIGYANTPDHPEPSNWNGR